jgi:hypothetical protein
MVITLKYKKSTKGTHVFEEEQGEGTPPVVKTLYVAQWPFKGEVKGTVIEVELRHQGLE